MENVILTVHLILALLLIGVVLLQRSEGGGLGMGGGGGGTGVMSGRQAANALTKLTWIFAAGFIATSITLTLLAAANSGSGSVLDRLGMPPAPASETSPGAPAGGALPFDLPPASNDAPALPPAAN